MPRVRSGDQVTRDRIAFEIIENHCCMFYELILQDSIRESLVKEDFNWGPPGYGICLTTFEEAYLCG